MRAVPDPLLSLARAQGSVDLGRVRAEQEVADEVAALALAAPGTPGPPTAQGLPGSEDLAESFFTLATRLLWGRHHQALQALVELVAPSSQTTGRDPGGQPGGRGTADAAAARGAADAAALLRAYRTLDELTDRGPGQPGTGEKHLGGAARTLLLGADLALEREDLTRCAALAAAALWLLFHAELHDSRPTSPLVDDPQGWLAPLHESRVGRVLTGQVRRSQAGSRRPTSALVLTGCYPRFAAPVVEALRQHQGVTVSTLDLSAVDKPFRRMAVEPWLVELRLRAGLGHPVEFAPLQQALDGADSVLADWGDAAAMLASLLTPSSTRLTVRVHSVDALRSWMHLIDWAAVDELICVGPHIQAFLRAQLGDRLSGCTQRVLPNIISLGRFDHPRGPDTDRTLAMVGWGRAVKDPLWSVELLARLRAEDPRWRLLLIGHPFEKALPPTGREYAARFTARVAAPDVAEAITRIPFTDDLAPVLARAGWVVSSSTRESWGVGPMEAVAAGAVPVIRNWPLLARWGGARSLYPGTWVVGSVEEAARRILRCTHDGARAAQADQARELLQQLVDPAAAAEGYRAVVLGARRRPTDPDDESRPQRTDPDDE